MHKFFPTMSPVCYIRVAMSIAIHVH